MSTLIDFEPFSVEDFRGPLLPTSRDPSTSAPNVAQLAQNVDYIPGQVKTRYGYATIANSPDTLGDVIYSMANWIFNYLGTPKNILAYYTPSGAHPGINTYDLVARTLTNLYNPAASKGASFAFAGTRLMIATFDANGNGSDQGRVYSYGVGADKLFSPPIQATPVLSETLPGVVTAGVHNIGYLILTRNGYTVSPSPVNGSGTFTPATITSSGGQNLHVSISPIGTWPSYSQSISLLMTTATNPNRYFIVPGSTLTAIGGSGLTVTFDINISDDTLAASGVDATPYFNLLSQDQSGNGPFNPSVVLEYNNRMVYITNWGGVPTIFVSDRDNYQQLSGANNPVFLPGQRVATTGFVLNRELYILGPHWTYMLSDNSNYPVTWARPQLIDSQIGTLAPLGATANPAIGCAFVANTEGLYVFRGGFYDSLPLSYWQRSDWKRINWAAGARVQVICNHDLKKVYVLAPLDSATNPSHILTWDYTQGLDAESVNYSLDSLANYAPGAIAPVQNTSQVVETWLGPPSGSLPVLRYQNGTEAQPYRDNNLAIASTYQTGLMPGVNRGLLSNHAVKLKIKGNGNLYVTVNELDNSHSITLPTIDLSQASGRELLRRYWLVSESVSYTLSTVDLDANFALFLMKHYFKPHAIQR